MDWQHILSYITGSVDEELRLRNEYLAVENRIFRCKIPGRVPLDDSDRATLAQIGKRLGLKALRDRSTFITERPDEYFGPSASSKGWHVQWELAPPGQESEAP